MFQNFLSNAFFLRRCPGHQTHTSFPTTEFSHFLFLHHSDLVRNRGVVGIGVVEFGRPRQLSNPKRSFGKGFDPLLHDKARFVTLFYDIRVARVAFVFVMLGLVENL